MRGTSLVVGAVATALAGCGGANYPTTSARIVSTAAAKTTQAGTARFTEKVTGTINGRSFGSGFLNGTVDNVRRRAEIAYDLSFLAKASRKEDPKFLKGRMVFEGDNAFVTGAAFAAMLPGRRRWVEITADQVSRSGGWADVAAVDPRTPVDHFRAAVGTTKVLGTEAVNGASTKHYRTHIDYRLYISLAPPDRRAALRRGIAKVERIASGTRFPAEAWIASDGTIRRAKGTIEGHGVKFEYTLELTAIGKRTRIALPPRTRVLDARKPP